MENKIEDFRLSVSKTKTFIDCKAKYKFGYIEKLPKKDWSFHIFGKFCHKVLEDFHKIYIDGSSEPYNKTIGECFKKAQTEYQGKMTPEMTKDCFAIINKYLKIASDERKNKIVPKVIAVEKPFELLIAPNLVLNGMIDRVQVDDDNVVHVCDYKTVKNKKYLKNDFFQLLTYAYVMLMEDPSLTKVRASYILLRHDFEYITTEFEVDQIKTIKDQYVEYAEKILKEKVFEPNPTILCNYCDFVNSCIEGRSKVMGNTGTFGEVNW